MGWSSSGQIRVDETRHPARSAIALHRHAAPYLALVLEGSYEEYSVDGVWVCEPGDLVAHPAWHLHANRFRDASCTVRNFRWVACDPSVLGGSARVCKAPDPGALLGRGRVDADTLADALARGETRPIQPPPSSLAGFASSLRDGPDRGVAALAARMGRSREHVARAFRSRFGLSPRDFRAEERMRRALRLIGDPAVSLSAAAYEAGFSDQAHFTRCVHAATRMTPGQIRRHTATGRHITFVQ